MTSTYQEEYDCLAQCTWEVTSEQQYQLLRKTIKNVIKTIVISTIKQDADGNSTQCKYCIVVFRNLDPHSWTKFDCFVLVESQIELFLLLFIATHNCTLPKQGDVSQAFVQSAFSLDEQYIVRLPAGCQLFKPNSYLWLIYTLYGLKKSPGHWNNKATALLQSLGLSKLYNSQCIHYGTLIPGQPPIYVALYVDDFPYFSKSTIVEQVFKTNFHAQISTTFQGPVTHFLGLFFQH